MLSTCQLWGGDPPALDRVTANIRKLDSDSVNAVAIPPEGLIRSNRGNAMRLVKPQADRTQSPIVDGAAMLAAAGPTEGNA
jgi:hypothetical protein